MLIYLAGLNSSHFATLSQYSTAARYHGAVLVSFFDYSDPSAHTVRSNHLIPPLKDNYYERQDLDQS